MTKNPYARFLAPVRQQAAALDPVLEHWDWEGHRVQLHRAPNPRSAVRVLVVHGAGGHGGALWPLAAQLAGPRLDVTAVDLPLYGLTRSPDPAAVRYDDWVRLLVDLVAALDDGRPLVLLGASIGGLLAVEAATRSGRVATVVATCLLNPADRRARARMTRFGRAALAAEPLLPLVRGRVARVMVPMSLVAKLSRMSRDRRLSRLCAQDPRGGAARVPLGFLTSYLAFRHSDPAAVTTPVLLAHPSHDAWTPVDLSARVLSGFSGPTRTVLLRRCGHFPIEEPGVGDLVDGVVGTARALETGPPW